MRPAVPWQPLGPGYCPSWRGHPGKRQGRAPAQCLPGATLPPPPSSRQAGGCSLRSPRPTHFLTDISTSACLLSSQWQTINPPSCASCLGSCREAQPRGGEQWRPHVWPTPGWWGRTAVSQEAVPLMAVLPCEPSSADWGPCRVCLVGRSEATPHAPTLPCPHYAGENGRRLEVPHLASG